MSKGYAFKTSNGISISKNKYSLFEYKNLSIKLSDKYTFSNLNIKWYKKTGFGFFSGNVDINNTPTKMTIKLYLANTKILVQETESYAHNGYFEFNNIADDEVYDMYAVDPNTNYDTKVKENITCMKNKFKQVVFNVVGISKAPPNSNQHIRFTLNAINTDNKPTYDIINAPSWLDYDTNTGLCKGKPPTYITSLILTIIVNDGDKKYEFIKNISFENTRFDVNYNNTIKDINSSFIETPLNEYVPAYESFPKGGTALKLNSNSIQYSTKDIKFNDILNGSLSIEITHKLNTIPSENKGLLLSSSKIFNNYFQIGYENGFYYMLVSSINGIVKTTFTNTPIVLNQWGVLSIFRNVNTFNVHYNGVRLMTFSNSESITFGDNLYVGNNPNITTHKSDLTIKKIKLHKNIYEQDDTYVTEYSFVNEEIAFPKTSFLYIPVEKRPATYTTDWKPSNANLAFKNNGGFYVDAYDTANIQQYISLPSNTDVIDLGTSNWTLYTDILLYGKAITTTYSSYVLSLFSTFVSGNTNNLAMYLNDSGNYYRTISPSLVIGGVSLSNYNTASTYNKIYYLKRHFMKVVRKGAFLYFYIDGQLSNKINIGTSKAFNFLGKNFPIRLGNNSHWTTSYYQYTQSSTLGFILQKNKNDIEEYNIYDVNVSKYNNIKMVSGNVIYDDYYVDKIVINGDVTTNDHFLNKLATHNVVITDNYNLNDVFTIRLTGTTFYNVNDDNLLSLTNTNGDIFNVKLTNDGINFNIVTNEINFSINNNVPITANSTYDIVICSDGYNLYYYIDGVLINTLDISLYNIIFNSCIIGDINLNSDSKSTVAYFQYSNDVYFNERFDILHNIEYLNKTTYKFLMQNYYYNQTSVKNLYTNYALNKTSYSHWIPEIRQSNCSNLGDWTFEMYVTFTSDFNTSNQWFYESYADGDGSYSNFLIYMPTSRKIAVSFTSMPNITSTQKVAYSYTTPESFMNGDSVHLAVCRTGDYVKIFINGELRHTKYVHGLMSFWESNRESNDGRKPPAFGYNNDAHWVRGTYNYVRILNGIALYEDNFDIDKVTKSIPSESLTVFPSTTCLPLRYKMTK